MLDRVIRKCLTSIPQTITFQVLRRLIAQSANVPVPLVLDAVEARLKFSATLLLGVLRDGLRCRFA
jgi:hypothetical protein